MATTVGIATTACGRSWKRLRLGEATLRISEYKKGPHYMVTIDLEQGACPVQVCGSR